MEIHYDPANFLDYLLGFKRKYPKYSATRDKVLQRYQFNELVELSDLSTREIQSICDALPFLRKNQGKLEQRRKINLQISDLNKLRRQGFTKTRVLHPEIADDGLLRFYRQIKAFVTWTHGYRKTASLMMELKVAGNQVINYSFWTLSAILSTWASFSFLHVTFQDYVLNVNQVSHYYAALFLLFQIGYDIGIGLLMVHSMVEWFGQSDLKSPITLFKQLYHQLNIKKDTNEVSQRKVYVFKNDEVMKITEKK